jgi:hypothetical protein
MKKRVSFITLIAVLALHAATLYAEQTQVVPKSMPMQKLSISETIICPATIKVEIGTKVIPPSGWPGYFFGNTTIGNRAWITVPFKITEIKGDSLICWYQDNAFCSAINATTDSQKYGNCLFSIWQEKPGYFCEKATSNNGFVCRLK